MSHQRPISINGHWFWGNLPDFKANSLDFLENAARLSDITTLQFGPLRGYFVNHPDYVRKILSSQHKSFRKPSVIQRALSDITGQNIFTGNDDFWQHRRKIMQPAFHTQHIGDYANTMVNYTLRELENWEDGKEIQLGLRMTQLTMQIIIKTMFDGEINGQTNELGEIFTYLFQLVYRRMENYAMMPSWIPTKDNLEIHRMTKIIREIVRGFINDRRANNNKQGDLLSMLLNAQYEDGSKMSDTEIIREILTIFGAGFETTAYTITFAHYALAQNPDIANCLYEEIDRALGEKPVTLADLPQLNYTEMLVKETMRLYPTAWGFSRSTSENVEIGNYRIPKNSTILISPWTLGRDSRWFDKPLKFNPQRFNPDNEANIPKYAYIPFGGGARICIGNQFALMEARIIIATIAQKFRLTLKSGFDTKPQNVAFTLRPNNGMKMIARSRERQVAI